MLELVVLARTSKEKNSGNSHTLYAGGSKIEIFGTGDSLP